MIHMIHMIHTHKTVGHIFGTNLGKYSIHSLHMIDTVHDTYDTHDTYPQNGWSHLLHCWEREAYTHKQVGHISVTLDLYTVANCENSHIL